MPFDEALADRLRQRLAGTPGISERKMFGGMAFLLDGRMAIVASGRGGLMVRVDATEATDLIEAGRARPAEMRGRPLAGWVRLDSSQVPTREALSEWVERGVRAVRALPGAR